MGSGVSALWPRLILISIIIIMPKCQEPLKGDTGWASLASSVGSAAHGRCQGYETQAFHARSCPVAYLSVQLTGIFLRWDRRKSAA